MGLECIVVVAHAMGRTLVIPPKDDIYLLDLNHTDRHNSRVNDEMGFEDFFELELLKSHQGERNSYSLNEEHEWKHSTLLQLS